MDFLNNTWAQIGAGLMLIAWCGGALFHGSSGYEFFEWAGLVAGASFLLAVLLGVRRYVRPRQTVEIGQGR